MRNGLKISALEGYDDLELVGESHYQENLWTIIGEKTGERVRHDILAVLVAERDNPHDGNAVAGWVSGLKVGYLNREDASSHRGGLLQLQATHGTPIGLRGVIAGGGIDDEGRRRMLGVFLNYDRADFGLVATRWGGRDISIDTGLSNFTATDAEGDSYDLAWRQTQPTDPTQCVTYLRRQLHRETSAVSRHYLFAELEATLYRLRTESSTALEEYDAACRAHDREMDEIVPLLVEKLGVVPRLDTYRQAAIRHHKAQDIQTALWWAQRGLALYGNNPAKPDAMDDLSNRAARYRRTISADGNGGRR